MHIQVPSEGNVVHDRAAATTALAAAQALAERHHREQVGPEHLTWALAEDETGPFATVLGASPPTIRGFRARLDQE